MHEGASTTRGTGRRWGMSVAASLTLGLIACLAEVDGERAETGSCPEGEVCSAATPEGLRFIGHAFWDDETIRLGPVLVGGTFDLGIRTVDGSPLPEFDVEVEDPGVFAAEPGGAFALDGFDWDPDRRPHAALTLYGRGEGSTRVRIVDRETGELLDRLRVEAYEIGDVSVTNMNDPGRDYLIAGCEELLAVRLLVKGTDQQVRGFDQSVKLRADGVVRQEPDIWDCFAYTAPNDRTEITVEVETAGKTFTRILEVRTMLELGLRTCPERVRRD